MVFFIRVSSKFVAKGPMDKTSVLVRVMALHRTGDESLPEPMLTISTSHICGITEKWVKTGSRVCFSSYVSQDVKLTRWNDIGYSVIWLAQTHVWIYGLLVIRRHMAIMVKKITHVDGDHWKPSGYLSKHNLWHECLHLVWEKLINSPLIRINSSDLYQTLWSLK